MGRIYSITLLVNLVISKRRAAPPADKENAQFRGSTISNTGISLSAMMASLDESRPPAKRISMPPSYAPSMYAPSIISNREKQLPPTPPPVGTMPLRKGGG